MNILKSLLASNTIMIICYVFDIILILCAVGLFVWYYIKSSKAQGKTPVQKKEIDTVPEKIDDDTYVLPQETEMIYEEEQDLQRDNVVEHFVNQISEISEPQTTTLKSNAVIVNHEVQRAEPKKRVKKEEISNFVVIGGVNKAKAEPAKTHNVGVNAFQNSENFFNTIKEVNSAEAKQQKAEKTTAPKAATKTTAAKKTTTAKKSTTAKKKTTTKK